MIISFLNLLSSNERNSPGQKKKITVIVVSWKPANSQFQVAASRWLTSRQVKQVCKLKKEYSARSGVQRNWHLWRLYAESWQGKGKVWIEKIKRLQITSLDKLIRPMFLWFIFVSKRENCKIFYKLWEGTGVSASWHKLNQKKNFSF